MRTAPYRELGFMIVKPVLVLGLVATALFLAARYWTPDRPNEEITALSPGSTPTLDRIAVVTDVIDGDTIDVDLHHRTVRIRLIGVDTPEVFFGVDCFGPQASGFTKAMLDGAEVRLEFDADRLDDFDRTLAYVWLGDRLFNRALVARGFAKVDTVEPNDRYEDVFLAADRRARDANRGLWARCAGCIVTRVT